MDAKAVLFIFREFQMEKILFTEEVEGSVAVAEVSVEAEGSVAVAEVSAVGVLQVGGKKNNIKKRLTKEHESDKLKTE